MSPPLFLIQIKRDPMTEIESHNFIFLISFKRTSFENSYIPENPRTPKPLTFSKNRLRGAKNRSNISPVAKKKFRKNDFFFSKNFAYVQTFFVCICAQFFVLFQNRSKTRNFFKFFYRSLYNTYLKRFVKKNLKKNAKKKSCTYAQKIKKSCTYAKVKKKYRFFGNFFQRIVMIKNVLEGSEVGQYTSTSGDHYRDPQDNRCWDLLRTHIFPRTRELPQFPISPKPLFLSKNRLRNPPKRSYKKNLKKFRFSEKKKSFFRKFFFATGLIFERFLAPRSRFFEKVNDSISLILVFESVKKKKKAEMQKEDLQGFNLIHSDRLIAPYRRRLLFNLIHSNCYAGGKHFVTAEELREELRHLRDEKALIVKLVDLLPKWTDFDCIGDWVVEATMRKKLN
ncbi:hypothetical protein LXL04_018164 [Taraxacum kok-saghyz]